MVDVRAPNVNIVLFVRDTEIRLFVHEGTVAWKRLTLLLTLARSIYLWRVLPTPSLPVSTVPGWFPSRPVFHLRLLGLILPRATDTDLFTPCCWVTEVRPRSAPCRPQEDQHTFWNVGNV